MEVLKLPMIFKSPDFGVFELISPRGMQRQPQNLRSVSGCLSVGVSVQEEERGRVSSRESAGERVNPRKLERERAYGNEERESLTCVCVVQNSNQ